jgi:hypothetical protein
MIEIAVITFVGLLVVGLILPPSSKPEHIPFI